MIASPLAACAATLVVETVLALPSSRFTPWTRGVPLGRRLVDVPLANLLTQPLAQWIYGEGLASFIAIELGVIAVEAAVYRFATGLPGKQAVFLSGVLNAATIAIAIPAG